MKLATHRLPVCCADISNGHFTFAVLSVRAKFLVELSALSSLFKKYANWHRRSVLKETTKDEQNCFFGNILFCSSKYIYLFKPKNKRRC